MSCCEPQCLIAFEGDGKDVFFSIRKIGSCRAAGSMAVLAVLAAEAQPDPSHQMRKHTPDRQQCSHQWSAFIIIGLWVLNLVAPGWPEQLKHEVVVDVVLELGQG